MLMIVTMGLKAPWGGQPNAPAGTHVASVPSYLHVYHFGMGLGGPGGGEEGKTCAPKPMHAREGVDTLCTAP